MEQLDDNFIEMQEQQLPSGLNVLTILTIIGCVIGLGFGIFEFVGAEKRVADLKALMSDKEKMEQMPEFAKKMLSQETLDLAQKQADNKLPMMIFGVLAVGLCFYGAIQMRQRKMQGYYFWLIGEILPILAMLIFIGMAPLKGFGILGIIIPAIFILLYTLHRKYLTK